MNTKKKTFISITAMAFISVTVYLFQSQNKFSLSEIDADNYTKLREEGNVSLLDVGHELHKLFDFPAIFSDAKNMVSNSAYKVSASTVNGFYFIEIFEISSGNTYLLRYPNVKSDVLQIVTMSRFFENTGIGNGQVLIQKLLNEDEYSLKTSRLKNHEDILIKEVGSHFVIGQIRKNKYEKIVAISFHIYDRQKKLL